MGKAGTQGKWVFRLGEVAAPPEMTSPSPCFLPPKAAAQTEHPFPGRWLHSRATREPLRDSSRGAATESPHFAS